MSNRTRDGLIGHANSIYRVDNGWDIDPSAPFLPLRDKPPLSDKFKADVKNTNIKNIISNTNLPTMNERSFYDTMYMKGKPQGSMNWEVARYKFHLFLRYCDQTNYIF
jgi:hypothetical protein